MTGESVRFTAEEARVLGAMIEKEMTTPDNYPMSLNAVTTACNQVSNRDPVTEYPEGAVERTLRALADRGLVKMVHRPGDRVVKYRHALGEALETGGPRLALLAVLLLRGAQTPGELRQRTGRYVEFDSLAGVETTLEELRARGLVRMLPRQLGQKEHRYLQLLAPGEAEGAAGPTAAANPPAEPDDLALPGDLDAVRAEVAELRRRLDALVDRLGIDDL